MMDCKASFGTQEKYQRHLDHCMLKAGMSSNISARLRPSLDPKSFKPMTGEWSIKDHEWHCSMKSG